MWKVDAFRDPAVALSPQGNKVITKFLDLARICAFFHTLQRLNLTPLISISHVPAPLKRDRRGRFLSA